MTALDLTRFIEQEADPGSLIQRVTEEAQSLVDCAVGAATLVPRNGRLRAVAASGAAVDHVRRSVLAVGTLSGLAIADGEMYYSDNVSSDARIDARLRVDPQALSMVTVPLRHTGEVIGALVLISDRPAAFTAERRSLLLRVADFAGVALASVIDTKQAVSEVVRTLGEMIPVTDVNGDDQAFYTAPGPVLEFVTNVLRPGAAGRFRAHERIESVLDGGRVRTVVQPIVNIDSGRLVGAEALSRFPIDAARSPNIWFNDAHHAGLGIELETLALRRALGVLDELPEMTLLSVNASHDLIVSGHVHALLQGLPAERILLELTEHVAFTDYALVRAAIRELRTSGIRLAVDDVGAGFSCFRHIVELEPEWIKLDRSLIAGIELDLTRRSMAEALVTFAEKTGTRLIAEGIETPRQLEIVRELGVHYGQGYLLAPPSEVATMPLRFDHIARHATAAPPTASLPVAGAEGGRPLPHLALAPSREPDTPARSEPAPSGGPQRADDERLGQPESA